MAIAAVLALTLDPALRMMFSRMDYHHFRPRWLSWLWNTAAVGRYYPEEQHPISKQLFRVYEPACNFVLRHKALTLVVALILVLTTIPVYFQLGSEFMPPLDEGSLLYMPTTVPGISVAEVQQLMQTMDKQLARVPRSGAGLRQGAGGDLDRSRAILHVGNHHRAQVCRPVAEEGPVVLQLSRIPPSSFAAHLARQDQPRRTGCGNGPGDAVSGVTNAWTMPIKARIDMLTTAYELRSASRSWGPTSRRSNE